MDSIDVLVVGAGIAGLSCARALVNAGKRVRVLERSQTVGGRCATKVNGDQIADFGPMFIHGDDPDFLNWVESAGVGLVPGWPRVVEGSGTPCLPQAFDPLQRRYAVKGGIRQLAEALAAGLDVVTGAQVDTLEWTASGVGVATADGQRLVAKDLVIALALEQSRQLLLPLQGGPGSGVLKSTDALLGQFASLPCLTVIAVYPKNTTLPSWDVWYPANSSVILMVSNEGTKRDLGGEGVLVVQARPAWSARHLETEKEAWASELLAETAQLLGPWAALPTSRQTHRWRYGRLAPADHLYHPLVLEQPGYASRVGLAGDLFGPSGGLQGAWLSGRKLAGRLIAPR